MDGDAWIWAGRRKLEVCICCKAMRSAGHYGDCELASLLRRKEQGRRIAWAYLLDSAGQYDNESGYVACLENLAVAMLNGEHERAFDLGDLDDILARAPRNKEQKR